MAARPKGRSFKVDARLLLSLGRESIKDQTTALVELVKNSYDADATTVEIDISAGEPVSLPDFIRISDDGNGMTSADIDQKWLRVGYSAKRRETRSRLGRRETGEKGVGRLSADRLGATMELRSRVESGDTVGISVNWNDFDKEGIDIDAVSILDVENPNPTLPMATRNREKHAGTEIIIGALRQGWSETDVRRLYAELSTLISPDGVPGRFDIYLKRPAHAKRELISSAFDLGAELEIEARYDSKGNLSYGISQRPRGSSRRRHNVGNGTVSWPQSSLKPVFKRYVLSGFSLKIAVFPRDRVSPEAKFTLSQLREFLDTRGGIKIYRDGIKVKPYGDPDHPEGDWLGLSARKTRNPAGAGRIDFRFAANQLVGSVFIGRDTNPSLADSAAREGLIQHEAYAQLTAAVYQCISLLETKYHTLFNAEKTQRESEPQTPLPDVVTSIKDSLRTLTKDLSSASARDDRAQTLEQSVALLQVVREKIEIAEKGIEELASQGTVFRGLATVGISAAVFAHETESALAQARLSSTAILALLEKTTINVEKVSSHSAHVRDAVTKVEMWGQFALLRVKRDKRRRVKLNLSVLMTDLVREISPLFEAVGVDLQAKIQSEISVRAFAMDLEAVAMNFLTNAYHAVTKSGTKRKVLFSLTRTRHKGNGSIRIEVQDSGPGITKENLEQIWVPLFSTRTDERGRLSGTGLGLTIVQSVARENNGTTSVVAKGALGGAAFTFEIPERV